jgi:acetyl esterase/lipase
MPDISSKHTVTDIHGGAFMLGAAGMVNKDQVEDCLSRGWIVLVPNHRLCPQVDVLEGPMKDCRDLLAWIYDGSLQTELSGLQVGDYKVDLDHVFAFGTSSGGTLALSLVRGRDNVLPSWSRPVMLMRGFHRDLTCRGQSRAYSTCTGPATSPTRSGPAPCLT